MRILTIGHSTRPVEDTIELLRAHGVARLADVRSIPASRRNPQYGQAALAASLERAGIAYEHRKGLGGLRKPVAGSRNTSWQNASFRGYADYMQTDAFRSELESLVEAAGREPLAIMCAEAVPWRCHRSLISDALLARGHEVLHIITSAAPARPHQMTRFARRDGERIVYDG